MQGFQSRCIYAAKYFLKSDVIKGNIVKGALFAEEKFFKNFYHRYYPSCILLTCLRDSRAGHAHAPNTSS